MKNILIISSSPRKKGNSQILCEQFQKGAETSVHRWKPLLTEHIQSGSTLEKKKFIILYRLVWIKILLKDHWGIWMVLWSIWRNTELPEGYMQQTSWMPDWSGNKVFLRKLMIWDTQYKRYMSGESYNANSWSVKW